MIGVTSSDGEAPYSDSDSVCGDAPICLLECVTCLEPDIGQHMDAFHDDLLDSLLPLRRSDPGRKPRESHVRFTGRDLRCHTPSLMSGVEPEGRC